MTPTRRAGTAPPRIPRATYRIQLHAGFTFGDATAIVPYLASLGISHLYTSPVLQAAPGSTHGYDVVDHSRVSEELGGEAGFERLTDALHAHGMGLVLDIVPNHMAINDPRNRWWWDVLQHGPASRWAGHFDIDWDPPESRLRNVILLPVLPDHYGRVLEAGEIRLGRERGRFVVEHGALRFPLDPRSIGWVVVAAADRIGSEGLASIGSALGQLPRASSGDPEQVSRRRRDADVLLGRLDALADAEAVGRALDAQVAAINGDVDALDALLAAQTYRLAYWRSAARDLGYRRFFDVDQLIGLRTEAPEVVADTHRLTLQWVASGRVDGLRIDHPDGLRDPAGYFARLREAAPDAWIVAEKILEADEAIPDDWPIDGTTGYGFANLATGVLVDPAGQRTLDDRWSTVADTGPSWDDIVAQARTLVLSELLGSDVNRLTKLFLAVCEANRRYRDFTRHELHEAIREVAAALPVYRTYVRAGDRWVADVDATVIGVAVHVATERRPDLAPELFAFLGRVLRLEVPGDAAAELAMRFQQLTPAAMAKGVEDTAFYRYLRLTALNEVGGDPSRFGVSPESFHAAMAEAAERWPHAMLALSTHDTKRSADVRARIALLSQDADDWAAAAAGLAEAASPYRGHDGPSDAVLELLLQTLVGTWPIDADRAAAYLLKAVREAKVRTSWTDPDPACEAAVEHLVRGALADRAFVAAIERVVARLVDPGRAASLAQVALHLTAPGVPDLYQGSEIWDLSLVDPDNRRPVDYERLARLRSEAASCDAADAWARREEGLAKMWLVSRLLDLRRRHLSTFADAGYRPLPVHGPMGHAALAFERGGEVVTVVPRLPLHVAREGWGETRLDLPQGAWYDLDGAQHRGRLRLGDLLAAFPVAVLERVS